MSGGGPTVGNDMDVQLWRQFDQPISQSCFPKRGVMDSASAQHDLCNTCQAGKLRDLIRYIITVDRFDRSTQLLGQMQIGLEPGFIFLRHPLKCLGFYK